MKQSLSQRILNYMKTQNNYINGGEIEKLGIQWGYKGSTTGRVLRDLSSLENGEPELLKEERKGKEVSSVWYKINDNKYTRMEYIVPETGLKFTKYIRVENVKN